CYSIHWLLIISLHLSSVHGRLLGLFTWLQKLDNIRNNNKVSSKNGSVTWFGLVNNTSSQNNIN
ncbi:MAG: hypothetical protein ACK55I_01890, partial [bacterium]